MKTTSKLIVILFAMTQFLSCEKDEPVIDFITFEEVTLNNLGYWNGSDNSGGFTSGNAFFPNSYTDFGDGLYSWIGFACSNHTDKNTAGWLNQYSSWTGEGANMSEKYAVLYQGDTIVFTVPERLESMQVSNSTYAAITMQNGDEFAKKFGPEDYFHLIIRGIDDEGNSTGVAKVGLADFTSEDSNLYYISNQWNLIKLDHLGVVKKLAFRFESSDIGDWGINTPSYACIDNIKGTLQE